MARAMRELCSASVVGFHPASERWWWTCISQNFKDRSAFFGRMLRCDLRVND
jgi:hypothetical protein